MHPGRLSPTRVSREPYCVLWDLEDFGGPRCRDHNRGRFHGRQNDPVTANLRLAVDSTLPSFSLENTHSPKHSKATLQPAIMSTMSTLPNIFTDVAKYTQFCAFMKVMDPSFIPPAFCGVAPNKATVKAAATTTKKGTKRARTTLTKKTPTKKTSSKAPTTVEFIDDGTFTEPSPQVKAILKHQVTLLGDASAVVLSKSCEHKGCQARENHHYRPEAWLCWSKAVFVAALPPEAAADAASVAHLKDPDCECDEEDPCDECTGRDPYAVPAPVAAAPKGKRKTLPNAVEAKIALVTKGKVLKEKDVLYDAYAVEHGDGSRVVMEGNKTPAAWEAMTKLCKGGRGHKDCIHDATACVVDCHHPTKALMAKAGATHASSKATPPKNKKRRRTEECEDEEEDCSVEVEPVFEEKEDGVDDVVEVTFRNLTDKEFDTLSRACTCVMEESVHGGCMSTMTLAPCAEDTKGPFLYEVTCKHVTKAVLLRAAHHLGITKPREIYGRENLVIAIRDVIDGVEDEEF